MPSLSTAKRISNVKTNSAKTIGEIHKSNSYFAMEETWYTDKQAKTCYVYDYFHDDMKDLNVGMTYENTTKTKIDAKIIVTTYGSISKDYPTLLCQFKPSQKMMFDENDELYYLEDYRKKYHTEDIFCGTYIDIPDGNGVYRKHMICMKDVEQDFQKYFILPCDYKLQWVEKTGSKKIKRSMWCALRSQSSYNSGLLSD